METDASRLHRLIGAKLSLPGAERGIRWALATLFIYSGAVKLIDPQRFAEVIAGFGLLPDVLIFPAAILLPVLEVVTGVGLIFALRGSLAAITIMLILFMAVLGYGIRLGLDIDCGCFGPDDPEQAYKGLKSALVRDAVLMAAVFFLYWSRGRIRLRAGRLEQ
ncbi:MAG: DoxX family membrane protein [Desulfobulbaceae bacterium]|jgi:uncharacterized membrane protein YphA (DoxX/SURF4 family)|nr:DoxX family membrane protein [Desulfobulbaceae bacterium]